MTGFSLGRAAAKERLRGAAGYGVPALFALLVVASAVVERRAEVGAPGVAADVTLAGAALGVSVPLVAYFLVALAAGSGRLDDAVRHIARHGGNRRAAIVGLTLETALHVAVASALIAALGVSVAHGHSDAAVLKDIARSAVIAALGGGVYTAWLSLGSLFGRAGGGRLLALGLDAAASAGPSALAALLPRAHLRGFIGGELVLGLSAGQSAAALALLGGTYLLLASWRVAP